MNQKPFYVYVVLWACSMYRGGDVTCGGLVSIVECWVFCDFWIDEAKGGLVVYYRQTCDGTVGFGVLEDDRARTTKRLGE